MSTPGLKRLFLLVCCCVLVLVCLPLSATGVQPSTAVDSTAAVFPQRSAPPGSFEPPKNQLAEASPESSSDAPLATAHVSAELERLTQAVEHLDDRVLQVGAEGRAAASVNAGRTFWAVIIGALCSSIVTWIIHARRIKHERRAERSSAGLKGRAELMTYRARQLNELYVPLQALLLQSKVVRDELYEVLIVEGAGVHRFVLDQDMELPDKRSLFVVSDGTKKPFRLIDYLYVIARAKPSLLPRVEVIVSINQAVVRLLQDKVGFIRPASVELSRAVGTFLAHQRILEDVFAAAKKLGDLGGQTETSSALPIYNTAFPRELPDLVSADVDALRRELADWEKDVTEWCRLSAESE